MPSYQTTRRVQHSAEDMFRLVSDVERYPEFVPLCEGISVRGRERDGDVEIIIADMTVAYKVVRETFTSRAIFDLQKLQIRVDYLDGPFRYLENRWVFEALGPKSCEINFSIAYEFRSRSLGLLMGAMFDKAFRKFATAFEQRADVVYGLV